MSSPALPLIEQLAMEGLWAITNRPFYPFILFIIYYIHEAPTRSSSK